VDKNFVEIHYQFLNIGGKKKKKKEKKKKKGKKKSFTSPNFKY